MHQAQNYNLFGEASKCKLRTGYNCSATCGDAFCTSPHCSIWNIDDCITCRFIRNSTHVFFTVRRRPTEVGLEVTMPPSSPRADIQQRKAEIKDAILSPITSTSDAICGSCTTSWLDELRHAEKSPGHICRGHAKLCRDQLGIKACIRTHPHPLSLSLFLNISINVHSLSLRILV